jgi:hypothetical protein
MQKFDDAFSQTCENAWPFFISKAGSTYYPLHDNSGKRAPGAGQLIAHATSAELPQHVVRNSSEKPEALVRRALLVHEPVERLYALIGPAKQPDLAACREFYVCRSTLRLTRPCNFDYPDRDS